MSTTQTEATIPAPSGTVTVVPEPSPISVSDLSPRSAKGVLARRYLESLGVVRFPAATKTGFEVAS